MRKYVNYMPPKHDFRKLENLRTDWSLLFPKGYFHKDTDCSPAKVLPASLKRLHLNVEEGEHRNEYNRFMKLIRLDRASGKNHLSDLYLGRHPGWVEPTAKMSARTVKSLEKDLELYRLCQEECRAVGIALYRMKWDSGTWE